MKEIFFVLAIVFVSMIPSIPSLYELKLHKVYNVSGLNDLLFPFYYFQIMNNYIFF